jgi:plastocyanin
MWNTNSTARRICGLLLFASACTTSTAPPAPAPIADAAASEPAPEEAEPATPTTHTVTVTNFAYSPKTLRIKPGDTVKWVFKGGTHSVTSGKACKADGAFDSEVHDSPFTYTRTFEEMGKVDYFCSYREHCEMGQAGVIDVQP